MTVVAPPVQSSHDRASISTLPAPASPASVAASATGTPASRKKISQNITSELKSGSPRRYSSEPDPYSMCTVVPVGRGAPEAVTSTLNAACGRPHSGGSFGQPTSSAETQATPTPRRAKRANEGTSSSQVIFSVRGLVGP